jgi:TRAP-type C4-dicarboxylate transport system permease small subunit
MPRKHIEVIVPVGWSDRPARIVIYSVAGLLAAICLALAAAGGWLWFS